MTARATNYLVGNGELLLRRLRPDAVDIVDVALDAVSSAEGELARDLVAYAQGETPSHRLTTLAATTPLLSRLLSARRPFAGGRAEILARGGYDTLFLELVARCNERCVHCYAGSAPGLPAALSTATAFSIVEDAQTLGVRRVQLTGGEPLLYDALAETVARIQALGMTAEVFTNGQALGEPLLAALVAFRPSFALSVYSHRATTHDAITRTPGSHVRTLAAIDRLLDRGLAVRVAIILMSENAAEVAETVAFLRERGLTDVGTASMRAAGRGRAFDGPAANVKCPDHRDRGFGERSRRGTLAVLPNGDVVPCIFNRVDVLGNVGVRRLLDVARAPARLALDTTPSAALLSRCRATMQCADCRATAFALRAGGQ